MAGITDCAFRSFMREMGAGVVVTELVSATGLKHASSRTRQLMRFDESQHPVGIQLFGEDIDALSSGAKEVEQMGADFVDINFGCPVPKVVKRGAGSAALKDLLFLRNVLRSVKSAVRIPVTIKVRTGWDQNTRNTQEVAQIAYDEGITWVAIHGRTRAQGYSGESDWSYIAEIKAQSKIPIIGNGDISTAPQAIRRLRESRCDGVMIGRGCLKNPWIFREALALWNGNGETEISEGDKNFTRMFRSLLGHLQKTTEPRIVLLQMKKLASWYSAGLPGAAQFRKLLFTRTSLEEVEKEALAYYSGMGSTLRQDTSHEPFLMGGHG